MLYLMHAEHRDKMRTQACALLDESRGLATGIFIERVVRSAVENASERDYEPGTDAREVFAGSVGTLIACCREDFGATRAEWAHVRRWFERRGYRG